MSALPWFKFYPGDYLADTQRLTQAQHGAYILLLLDYYSSGPPPDDDRTLMAIARSESLSDWKAIRLAIERYFEISDGTWFHARCELEIARRQSEHDKKSDAGKKGNKIKWGTSQSDRDAYRKSIAMSDTRSQNQSKPICARSAGAPINGKPNLKTLLELGVDEKAAVDWLAVRKAKRAPLTDSVIDNLKREAEKAGITVAQAVVVCAKHSWQGFQADWKWQDSDVNDWRKDIE